MNLYYSGRMWYWLKIAVCILLVILMVHLYSASVERPYRDDLTRTSMSLCIVRDSRFKWEVDTKLSQFSAEVTVMTVAFKEVNMRTIVDSCIMFLTEESGKVEKDKLRVVFNGAYASVSGNKKGELFLEVRMMIYVVAEHPPDAQKEIQQETPTIKPLT